MKRAAEDQGRSEGQRMQRVRVGLIGLAAVIVLIGLASLLFSGVRERRAAAAAGGGNAAAVATMSATDGTESALNESDQPLADLGVSPGAASVEAPDNAQAR